MSGGCFPYLSLMYQRLMPSMPEPGMVLRRDQVAVGWARLHHFMMVFSNKSDILQGAESTTRIQDVGMPSGARQFTAGEHFHQGEPNIC